MSSPPEEAKYRRDLVKLGYGAALVNKVHRKKLKEEERAAAFEAPLLLDKHYDGDVPESTLNRLSQDVGSPEVDAPPCLLCNKPIRAKHPQYDCDGFTQRHKHLIHWRCPGKPSPNKMYDFTFGGQQHFLCKICRGARKDNPTKPYFTCEEESLLEVFLED